MFLLLGSLAFLSGSYTFYSCYSNRFQEAIHSRAQSILVSTPTYMLPFLQKISLDNLKPASVDEILNPRVLKTIPAFLSGNVARTLIPGRSNKELDSMSYQDIMVVIYIRTSLLAYYYEKLICQDEFYVYVMNQPDAFERAAEAKKVCKDKSLLGVYSRNTEEINPSVILDFFWILIFGGSLKDCLLAILEFFPDKFTRNRNYLRCEYHINKSYAILEIPEPCENALNHFIKLFSQTAIETSNQSFGVLIDRFFRALNEYNNLYNLDV
jgi:hypothetical protein